MKKWLITIGTILLVFLLLFVFRFAILSGIGNHLMIGTAPQKSPVMFVLSGAPVERGLEAAKLYKEGFAKKIVCTGGNQPQDFEALGLNYYECALTKAAIIKQGIPGSVIQAINKGTSTHEEVDVVLNYCLVNHIDTCIILSSDFHTRRVRHDFKNKLEEKNIHVIICGAPASLYHEDSWWKNEYGLMAVNEEYMKMIYYALK